MFFNIAHILFSQDFPLKIRFFFPHKLHRFPLLSSPAQVRSGITGFKVQCVSQLHYRAEFALVAVRYRSYFFFLSNPTRPFTLWAHSLWVCLFFNPGPNKRDYYKHHKYKYPEHNVATTPIGKESFRRWILLIIKWDYYCKHRGGTRSRTKVYSLQRNCSAIELYCLSD